MFKNALLKPRHILFKQSEKFIDSRDIRQKQYNLKLIIPGILPVVNNKIVSINYFQNSIIFCFNFSSCPGRVMTRTVSSPTMNSSRDWRAPRASGQAATRLRRPCCR